VQGWLLRVKSDITHPLSVHQASKRDTALRSAVLSVCIKATVDFGRGRLVARVHILLGLVGGSEFQKDSAAHTAEL
jgi:hypothetical protein